MRYARQLLELARVLAALDAPETRQASLRRSASTAYYALLHLLISEAVSNWSSYEHRPALARVFEHGKIRTACVNARAEAVRVTKSQTGSSEALVQEHLRVVAESFLRVHSRRELADYDMRPEWRDTDAWDAIDDVSNAFESWEAIRHDPAAQAFLVSLFGTRRRAE